ncbi:MAG: hypothetical protein GC159_12540 [Phycisphaera sp.]|nr:hypothetical protein [Phycisphaera sp.]
MANIDQFESVFKSAAKEVLRYRHVEFGRTLIVTDLDANGAEALTQRVRKFLDLLGDATEWSTVTGDAFHSVQNLLDLVAERSPDLIVTYRHLHSDAWKWPYSLGAHLDVLTQATHTPVLVLPHPDADHALPHTVTNTDRVMAITDHLTGDDRLVNVAARLTERGGTLWLTHVEDAVAFERHIEAFSKIPEIDTAVARQKLMEQLLKEPTDYIASCRDALKAQGLDITIKQEVQFGRRIEEYERLVAEHEVDLLIMNTKDEDQLAMHGMAYPLAVQLRQIPLLML